MRKLIVGFIFIFAFLLLYACAPAEDEILVHEPEIEVVTNHELSAGNISGQYTGTLTDGIPTGNGSISVNASGSRWVFDGDFVNGAPANGKLTDYPLSMKIQNVEVSGVFTGDAADALPSGNGVFTASDSDMKYEGRFSNGNPTGLGEVSDLLFLLEYDSVDYAGVYNGEVNDGKISGEGTFDYEKDDVYLNYSGSWLDGAFVEEGFLKSNDFTVHFPSVSRTGTYEGEMLDGLASGHGVFSAVNDEGVSYKYTGEWENSLFNGQGVLIYDADDEYEQKGSFTDSSFAPTVSEAFISFGTRTGRQFSVYDYAEQFMIEHNDLFMDESKEDTAALVDSLKELTNSGYKYSEFTKNPSRYEEGVIRVQNLRILQIFEQEMWGYEAALVLAYDNSRNYYWIHYLSYAEGIFENNRITLYALPLDYFTYETAAGGKNWALACAAIYIHK